MNNVTPVESIQILLRHALTLGAGVLVGQGWIDSSQVDLLIGTLLSLGAVGWSAFNKSSNNTLIQKALDLPQGTKLEELLTK